MKTIYYNGSTPSPKIADLSVEGNNNANVVRFKVHSVQEDITINLTNMRAKLDIKAPGYDFIDKVSEGSNLAASEENGYVYVVWTMRRKHTQFRNLNVVVSFVDEAQDIVWKSEILEVINLPSIDCDKEIEDLEPSILQDLQKQIDDLDDDLDDKQDKLTFDDTPTAGSDNPVKSSGIKSYVDAAVEEAEVKCYRFKGSVNTVSLLPSGYGKAQNGWVYDVTENHHNYAWVWDDVQNAGYWDDLGGATDLSGYYLKTEVDNLLAQKQALITNATELAMKKLTAQLVDAGLKYVDVAPTEDNPYGLKIALLATEPATKYNGYLYIILGEQFYGQD